MGGWGGECGPGEGPGSRGLGWTGGCRYPGQTPPHPSLQDVWSWVTMTRNDDGPWPWVEDYSTSTDQAMYVDGDSNVTQLVDVVVKVGEFSLKETKVKQLVSGRGLKLLHAQGISTIGELADASVEQILRLRGYYLQEEVPLSEIYGDEICNLYFLAKAVVDKCSIDTRFSEFDGEGRMPWNVHPVFQAEGPAADDVPDDEDDGVARRSEPYWNAKWHGQDYRTLELPLTDEERIETWDGCTQVGREGAGWGGVGWGGGTTSPTRPSSISRSRARSWST